MQPAHRLLSAVALAFLSASSFASTVTYTSSAAFLAHVAPGGYTENFNSLGSPGPAGPILFSSGGFSYAVSAPSGLYANGFLGTGAGYEELTIDFTSGNVTAVGGNFFATDISDAFFAAEMNIALSDGTNVSFTPGSVADSYRGFTSDVTITSLMLTVSNVDFETLYAGLDNLTVGEAATAVPEPTSWALVGVAMAGLLITRRRTG